MIVALLLSGVPPKPVNYGILARGPPGPRGPVYYDSATSVLCAAVLPPRRVFDRPRPRKMAM
jgi:hypothetical protein